MSIEVCFHCGWLKTRAFYPCGECGAECETDEEFFIAYRFSDRFYKRGSLEYIGNLIADGVAARDVLDQLLPELKGTVIWMGGLHPDDLAHLQRAYPNRFLQPISQPPVRSWREFPHLVRAVEAFSRQPKRTREEQLAQVKRKKEMAAEMNRREH